MSAPAVDPALATLLGKVRTQVDAWTVHDRLDRKSAPRFNLFDFLRSDEIGLSNVFSWLMDPTGSHGQGADFLRSFLETFGVAVPPGLDTAKVRTEAPTPLIERNLRRLDVRVRIGDFVMAIENKPKAGWQPDQARDYLKQISADSSGHCLVVVKARPGILPEDQLRPDERRQAIDAGRLVDGDYSMIVRWLKACASATPSPELGMMLGHLSQKSAEFLGEKTDMRTDRGVADAILGDADLRRSAFDLLSAKQGMLGRVAARLKEDVAREVADALEPIVGRRVEAVGKYDPEEKWGESNLSFDFDATAPFVMMAGFHETELRGFYLGIETRGSVPADVRTLEQRLLFKDLFGREPTYHKAWMLWVDVTDRGPGDPSANTRGWEDMVTGDAARRAADWAGKIVKAMKNAGSFPWVAPASGA